MIRLLVVTGPGSVVLSCQVTLLMARVGVSGCVSLLSGFSDL